MLIEFSTENFRSIREEARLSLAASSGKELYGTNITEPKLPEEVKKEVKNIPLLRSAVLYGPNAGGKSNFISALATMRLIVIKSSGTLENLPITPFKFSKATLEAPTVFEVIILSDGIRYQYGFSATQDAIHEEWLFAFPKGRTQTWFKRSLSSNPGEYEYTFSDKLIGNKDAWKRATRPNALFLSTAIQLNNQQLKPVFNWFANNLHICGAGGWPLGFSIEWFKDSDNQKKQILDFLKAADFSISDIEASEEEISSATVFSNVPRFLEKILRDELQGKLLRVTTSHSSETGEIVNFDLDEESDGTQKILSYAGPWLDILNQGHVLFVDDLQDDLHPLLVQFLVQLFHNNETNKNSAQLVFSTHETSILDQSIFRRDQIWFCERSRQQDTKLYPLTKFNPRKGVDNLARAYLSGRYGALPFLETIAQSTEE